MTTSAALKSEHLAKIKIFLKEYVSTGKEVHFRCQEADSYADYILTENGLYTGGYAEFHASNGAELNPLLVNGNYKINVGYQSYENLYSNDDFYKHLQYGLATSLLGSIKE